MALLDRDEALESWSRWRRDYDLDRTDGGCFRLLPLVGKRLADLGSEDPLLARLKGIYRYTWSRNQLLMAAGTEALSRLEREGIRTMILKGTALSLGYYADAGMRPMDDVDILVPLDRAHDAIRVLYAGGWTPEAGDDPFDRVSVHHSAGFVDAKENGLDLHWYSLWQSAPDDAVWDAAVPLRVGNAETLAPCATDLLLQICSHGVAHTLQPLPRWVADAVTTLRGAEDGIDWGRLVEQARARRATTTLAEALGYLRERFEPSIPSGAIAELSAVKAPLFERAARRAARRRSTPIRQLAAHWDRYRRLRITDPEGQVESSFGAHLKRPWGFDGYGQLSLHGARRLLGRR